MFRIVRLIFPVLLLILCGTIVAAPANIDVRFYPAEEYTRLALESDENLDHKVFFLDNPPRLVFDIFTDNHAIGQKLVDELNAESVGPASGYLKKIRAGENGPEKYRIVLELADEVDSEIFVLEPIGIYKRRLVLDITPQNSPDPLLDLLHEIEKRSIDEAGEGESLQKPPQRFVVVIDPGHGGEDPGAIGIDGQYEKHVVLDVSRRLSKRLEQTRGVFAVLTRDDDYFLTLGSRVRKAHHVEADLFVSIHADSAKSKKAHGASVFVLSDSGASSRFARQLAEKANLSDIIGGVSANQVSGDIPLENTLRRISADGKRVASETIAGLTLQNLGGMRSLHGGYIESAGFAVLKSPSIPSILVELGFLSNKEDASKLSSEDFREDIADEIADAIIAYRDLYFSESTQDSS